MRTSGAISRGTPDETDVVALLDAVARVLATRSPLHENVITRAHVNRAEWLAAVAQLTPFFPDPSHSWSERPPSLLERVVASGGRLLTSCAVSATSLG